MILARTELATIDALRASGEEPERILELIESIVNKGIDTGRFDMCHVETDPEAALRLAEALLGTNRYPAFARAMRILEAVTPYVEDRSDGMLLFTLSTIARMLCGRPFDAAGRAVSGIGEDERDVRLLYLLGILRAGEGRFDEAREWLLRADVESPDDPVILHALELVAARESLERILLTRPLWEDGDLDHTAPGTPERALRMACVELDPDGYADALIALNATGLELDDESFLRMKVELSGHAVPFVFEMNHAGLSKMDPAWLARLVESVSDVLEHAKGAPEHLVEVRARLDRSVRLVLTKPEPDTTRPSAIDYSFEVPSRCPRIEGRLDTGPEEAAVLKHLRALDLRGNLDEIIRQLGRNHQATRGRPEGEVHAALCLRTRPRDRQPKRIREGRPEKGACAARGSGRPDRRPLGDALLPSLPQPEARPEARSPQVLQGLRGHEARRQGDRLLRRGLHARPLPAHD